jgi:hypothetical protein
MSFTIEAPAEAFFATADLQVSTETERKARRKTLDQRMILQLFLLGKRAARAAWTRRRCR